MKLGTVTAEVFVKRFIDGNGNCLSISACGRINGSLFGQSLMGWNSKRSGCCALGNIRGWGERRRSVESIVCGRRRSVAGLRSWLTEWKISGSALLRLLCLLCSGIDFYKNNLTIFLRLVKYNYKILVINFKKDGLN